MKDRFAGKKHLFFDVDETLTKPRSPMAPHMEELLSKLPHDLIVVSGGEFDRIKNQVGSLRVQYLSQNGNHALGPDGEEYWNDRLTDEEASEIFRHIEELKSLGIESIIPDDCIEHRGSQICFSIMGHNAPVEKKRALDPDSAIRRRMLQERPFHSDKVEVRIGGTTTFDYIRKGAHKGSNIQRLIDRMNWERKNCVYFGDKLCPGGNDEAVIGIIDTVPVVDSEDTYRILKDAFGG